MKMGPRFDGIIMNGMGLKCTKAQEEKFTIYDGNLMI